MVEPDKLFGRLGNRLFQMAYIYSQMKKGEIEDVYVQDFNRFKDHTDDIKGWLGEGIGFLPYVAIHLRRGDYVNNPFYTQLWETGYYIDATNEFKGRKFLVFSDDVEWCKTYFEGDKFAFDDGNGEPHDVLNRMTSCDGHIIANSSFSWWGAFLSPHHGKVVYPKLWFTDGIQRVTFPETWVEI